MTVLEECYNAFAHECPLMSPLQKQVMFGRTKNVVSFSSEFYQELLVSGREYSLKSEEEILAAEVEEFGRWDRETSVGEVFWSSMVRIEKAFTGYCTHQEEASQTLQDLEKNDVVKVWLEECKKRSQERTKAWDIHSLLIKPVQRVLKYPLLLQGTPSDDHN